mgnify:FL=1
MRIPIFSVDGVEYPGVNVISLERTFAVMDGENAGRTMDGAMRRDIIGTYYNYNMELTSDYSDLSEYDKLYEVLSAPVDSHTIVVPYAQGTLEFKAYVANGTDNLLHKRPAFNKWNNLTVNFVAMKPQRRPAG